MIKRVVAIAGVLLAVGAMAMLAVAFWPERAGDGDTGSARPEPRSQASVGAKANGISGDSGSSRINAGRPTDELAKLLPSEDLSFALQPVSEPPAVHYPFKHPPAAGILFDVKSGDVLWQRRPGLERPIASLTKMMTALMVARNDPPRERVLISAKAASTPGSATGLLPRGRKVPLEALLKALIMISANDAAVALAEHDGGTVARFIKAMNRQAEAMGLSCTHYSTPNGLRDRGNYSCPRDLAALARADLAEARIAEIARTRYARPRFPIKGKRLHLANNHYFLQRGLTGIPSAEVTGLKTGYTDASGRCYVTTARLGGHHLGVVLLDSPNPLTQVPALLRAGFQELGAISPTAPPPRLAAPAD